MPVRIVQCLKHAMHDRKNLWKGDLSLVQPIAQRLAAYELQDYVVGGADLLEVMNLNEVRMACAGHDLCLLQEALQGCGVGGR